MKEQLREKILYQRTKQSPRDKAPKDQKITDFIQSLPEFQQAQEVLIYIAIHGEVDLTTLFEGKKGEKRFILPRVRREDNTLALYHVNSLDDLEKGTFSIPEPKLNLEKVEIETVDLAIIPGVGFGLDGHRIGYGGGFYDRLLGKMNCPKIGVAYEFQIVENIEAEDHDEKIDIIVTEEKITHISTP